MFLPVAETIGCTVSLQKQTFWSAWIQNVGSNPHFLVTSLPREEEQEQWDPCEQGRGGGQTHRMYSRGKGAVPFATFPWPWANPIEQIQHKEHIVSRSKPLPEEELYSFLFQPCQAPSSDAISRQKPEQLIQCSLSWVPAHFLLTALRSASVVTGDWLFKEPAVAAGAHPWCRPHSFFSIFISLQLVLALAQVCPHPSLPMGYFLGLQFCTSPHILQLWEVGQTWRYFRKDVDTSTRQCGWPGPAIYTSSPQIMPGSRPSNAICSKLSEASTDHGRMDLALVTKYSSLWGPEVDDNIAVGVSTESAQSSLDLTTVSAQLQILNSSICLTSYFQWHFDADFLGFYSFSASKVKQKNKNSKSLKWNK